jgi:hypothetical protein
MFLHETEKFCGRRVVHTGIPAVEMVELALWTPRSLRASRDDLRLIALAVMSAKKGIPVTVPFSAPAPSDFPPI